MRRVSFLIVLLRRRVSLWPVLAASAISTILSTLSLLRSATRTGSWTHTLATSHPRARVSWTESVLRRAASWSVARWVLRMLSWNLISSSLREVLVLNSLCFNCWLRLSCLVSWETGMNYWLSTMALSVLVHCWLLIWSPDEIVLQGYLVSSFSFKLDILSLDLALEIDFRHVNLPSNSVIDVAWNRAHRQRSLKHYSESERNQRVFDVVFESNGWLGVANSILVGFLKHDDFLWLIEVSPSIADTHINYALRYHDWRNNGVLTAIFSADDVAQKAFKLPLEFRIARERDVVQVDRLLCLKLERCGNIWRGKVWSWLWESSNVGVETWNDFFHVDTAVHRNKVLKHIKRLKSHEFECQHGLAHTVTLVDVCSNGTIHSWSSWLDDNGSGTCWEVEDAANGKTCGCPLWLVI